MNVEAETLEPPRDYSPQWSRALVALTVGLLVLIVAYWDTAFSIVHIWSSSSTFTHGFLIIPISGYLLYRQRDELRAQAPRTEPWALAALALGALLWLVAQWVDVNAARHFAFVAMIPAVVWALLGTRVAAHIAFPLAYLFFAVPFGEFLVPALQDITATFTVAGLRWSGIPVLWEGRYFQIPSGMFEVAEACSGVRYLIASLALGTLYAYITYRSLWRRAAFIVLSLLVPIIANGIRAYGIVMIADKSDYQLAIGVDHFIYGWVFFGVVMLLLFWVGGLFREREGAPSVGATVSAHPAPAPVYKYRAVAAAMVILIVSAPLFDAWVARDETNPAAATLTLPMGISGWEGPHGDIDHWQPSYKSATAQQLVGYRSVDRSVETFVARYAAQRRGAELASTDNVLWDVAAERRFDDRVLQVSLAQDQLQRVHEVRTQLAHGVRVIWYWYEVDGQAVVETWRLKLLIARARLHGRGSAGAVIAVSAFDDTDAERAQGALRDFLSAMHASLRTASGGAS